MEKVFVARHPLTYIKDVKFHTSADCPSFKRAHLDYKKIITRFEHENQVTFQILLNKYEKYRIIN